MKKPFTEKEISMASKKLRNGKSPGIDNMYAEYIKYVPGTTHQQRQIQGRGVRGAGGPFFLITYFFCNRFEELQTMLFEVELTINTAPLIYVYRNTIETCLKPNYLTDNYYILLIQHQL